MDSGCYRCRSSWSSTTSKNLSHNLISTFCFQFIFSFSADQIYYHRSNCWFHSTQFSFITGCLFHSFLTRVKMLDGSVKTNYQVTDLQIVMCKTPWSANIHSLHKSDPRPSSFPFQSVGNTDWHTRETAFPTEISENTSVHFKGYRRMSKASTSILQSHQCQSFDLQVERMNHSRSGPASGPSETKPKVLSLADSTKGRKLGTHFQPLQVALLAPNATSRQDFKRSESWLPEGPSVSYCRLP